MLIHFSQYTLNKYPHWFLLKTDIFFCIYIACKTQQKPSFLLWTIKIFFFGYDCLITLSKSARVFIADEVFG